MDVRRSELRKKRGALGSARPGLRYWGPSFLASGASAGGVSSAGGAEVPFSGAWGACYGWAGLSSGASIFWEIMWTFLAAGSMISGEEGRKPSCAWVEA